VEVRQEKHAARANRRTRRGIGHSARGRAICAAESA
jgi:hypothetical protein